MARHFWKDWILLCTFIFISYPKSCTSDCDPLPYRQEVHVVCRDSEKRIVDCYSAKLPSGSTATYKCEDHYVPAAVTMKNVGNPKRVLKCDRNRRRWNGYQHFQLLLCQVDCGVIRVESYIIGGQLTNTALWPWNAAIFVLSEDSRFIFHCGGTLIDTINEGFLVLTAAHCLKEDKRDMRVALGASSSDYDTVFRDKSARMFKVKRAVRHENYTPSRDYDNDIALLQLDSPICLASNIIPACLPRSEHQIKTGSLGDVVGFGHYNSEHTTSPHLRHTRIPVVPQENCNPWRTRKLDSSEICVGHLEGENGTCYGDSGSGLLFQYVEAGFTSSLPKKYVLGIVSHGPNNGKHCYTYTVFTKVSHFIPWIQDAVFPDDDSSEYYSRSPQKCGTQFFPEWTDSAEKFAPELTDYKFPTISTTSAVTQTISTTFRPNPTPTDIQLEGLYAHNRYRQSYGVYSLRLNPELTREAQSYADYLIREHIFINQPGKNFNKNIFRYVESGQRKDSSDIVRQAVDYWYNQRDNYDRNNPRPSTFTQIVWKSTTDLGIGLSSLEGANERRTIVVAAYSPPGNTITSDGRYFRENVPA